MDSSRSGIEWKAQLIIFMERDRFSFFGLSTIERYRMIKATDSILAELGC